MPILAAVQLIHTNLNSKYLCVYVFVSKCGIMKTSQISILNTTFIIRQGMSISDEWNNNKKNVILPKKNSPTTNC